MFGPEDQAYFRRRIAEERARAAAADRVEVRHAHLKFAALYVARLRDRATERPQLTIVDN